MSELNMILEGISKLIKDNTDLVKRLYDQVDGLRKRIAKLEGFAHNAKILLKGVK